MWTKVKWYVFWPTRYNVFKVPWEGVGLMIKISWVRLLVAIKWLLFG